MKRRIAATAATAALALGGGATASARPSPRTPLPTRPGGDPVAKLAHSGQSRAALALDLSRRNEMAGHRRHLGGIRVDVAKRPRTAPGDALLIGGLSL